MRVIAEGDRALSIALRQPFRRSDLRKLFWTTLCFSAKILGRIIIRAGRRAPMYNNKTFPPILITHYALFSFWHLKTHGR